MNETSFFSMDKLVEFGLSTVVAMQMTASMNQTLEGMRIPGADNSLLIGGSSSSIVAGQVVYYAAIDGAACGPYTLAELARLAAEKRIVKETYLWRPGMPTWNRAGNMQEVLGLISVTPPPIPAG